MKKVAFLFATLALAGMVLAGCTFEAPSDPNQYDDDGFGPPPDGHVWVKINVPTGRAARTSRTMTTDSDISFMDYYEVYFKETMSLPSVKPAKGSALEGRPLRIAVVPGKTYDVLLLAGNYEFRTLLASAFTGAVPIVEGAANPVPLDLSTGYIESDPVSTNFLYTSPDSTAVPATQAVRSDIVGSSTVKVISAGVGLAGSLYVTGDVVTIGTGTPPASFRVTASGGNIIGLALLDGGLYSTSQVSTLTGTPNIIGGTGSGATAATPITGPAHTVPNTTIPWFTYVNSGTTRSNDLTFKITTSGFLSLFNAQYAVDNTATAPALAKKELYFKRTSNGVFFPQCTATGTAAYSGGDMEITYTIPAGDLPQVTTYGRLYFELQYYPFGNSSYGSNWSIRNGFDPTLLDEDEGSLGGGLLVVIGEPGTYDPPAVTVELDH
jgi:hypothetical protein